MAVPRTTSKLPENAAFTRCSIPDNYIQACSARHVKFDSDSGLQCRFAYATWCPVCEEQERSKKVHDGGRRRSKSEGMDVERSDDYYIKATNNESSNYNPGVGFSKDKKISKKTFQQDKSIDRNSGNSPFDSLFTKRRLPIPVCLGPDTHVSDRREKSSKHVYKHCENHAEPNLVYETWNQSSQLGEWSYSKKDRPSDLIPLHERYYYEVELLRNKLHKLRDSEKSSRCPPEPEQSVGVEVGAKRPRDNSPTAYTTASAVRKPVSAVAVIRSNSAKPRKSSVLRNIGLSVTSLSSDSDFDDSACDEDDFKDYAEGEAEEDDPVIFTTAKSSTSSSSFASALPVVTSSFPFNQVSEEPVEVDQGKLHPGLRASLFSYVPPYIRFYPHDVKGPQLPTQIQKLLKWKLSTITPVVVRKTIVNSNFKLVRKSNEWCGTWGKHMKSLCFKTLREHQKINHFPGTFQIGRKDRLWKNLFRLMAKFGKKEFGFIPRTYVLPQDTKQLRSAWEKNCGKERWIVKPPASARGTGIKVIHKWTQIPKKCPLVVQKYIADPYLINGSKFDLRLYVLVASVNPLRIYLYDNGLVRFASVKYSNEMTSLCDRYMHLTNYSINKLSSQYTHNEDAAAQHGHKWSLHALWSHLAERGADVSALWASLVDLVIKTVISGESAISQLSAANLASRYCSYELFGIDVLLDERLKPWLLEVNISPSLHSSSPLDLAIKAPLVRELMNIAGYQIPNKFSAQVQSELGEQLGVSDGGGGTGLCFDRRLYTTALSSEERLKHVQFQQLESGGSCRSEYIDAILADLTPDDVRHLVLYEDEITQARRFQKIFPTTETHVYHQFFEVPRYYNMLFDAWEFKQCKNRATGISMLEYLCQKRVHLDTTQIPPKRTKVCTSPSASDRRIPEESETEAEADPDAARARPKARGWREVTLSCGIICRAARSRSGRPGLVSKPYPRSAYIVRRPLSRAAQQAPAS